MRPALLAVSLALVALILAPGLLLAQADPYRDLERRDGPRPAAAVPQPGLDYPLLELDSNFRLIGARTTMWLTENGKRELLGVLTQGAIQSLGGLYSFRKTDGGPVLATLNWKDLTLDVAGKILFQQGNETGPELGRVRQRTILSVGTGLDVYRKGEKPVGYVDEKAGKHLENLFIPAVLSQKYYSFENLSYRDVRVIKKPLFGKQREVTETQTERVEAFRFLGGKMKAVGPSGIFTTPDGKPILAVKGDWWLSKHIFDMIVARKEAEGAAGTAVTAIGILLGGETDEQRRDRIRREKEPVRNPSAYLGAFLAGLVYFPEWRSAVGVKLPISGQ
jgi:hypothetical protein